VNLVKIGQFARTEIYESNICNIYLIRNYMNINVIITNEKKILLIFAPL